MNEIANVIRVANTAFKTVKYMDIAKKIIVISASAACCIMAINFYRKKI